MRGNLIPFSYAAINSSVTETERLKLFIASGLFLIVINSSISGWSILRIPMFAPLRVPPCFITSVTILKTVIKDTGPLATPIVEATTSSLGLSFEKENPVPPPD